jgi:DNA-binding CsgD family transcriptional regulator
MSAGGVDTWYPTRPATGQPALVGRAPELAIVSELIRKVSERGQALVVRGEAGIGKSALLAEATDVACASGMATLTAAGVPSESPLAFAGLHQLLQPVKGRFEMLAEPQRLALRAAFGGSSSQPPDLFLIALATLELLAEQAARAPLLLIAEDAQWMDRPTTDVLTFLARRIERDPIAVLISMRAEETDPFEAAHIPHLDLRPLDDVASRQLLTRHATGLTAPAQERLLDQAAGNPLALLELPRALELDYLADDPLAAPLPLTARLERAFGLRLRELPEETSSLLLVAAADGRSVLREVLDAAAALKAGTVSVATLQPAIDRGLVSVEQSAVRFRHPLIRSAAYRSAAVNERLAAHRALATILEGQPDRSVWHLAAACLGPDETVAARLEQAAGRSLDRGAVMSATQALERAADLSERPDARARRLLRAAELTIELGRPDGVLQLVAKVDDDALGSSELARLALIRHLVRPREPEAHEARRTLTDVAEQIKHDGDDQLALDLLCLAATRCWWRDPGTAERSRITDALQSGENSAPGDPRVISGLAYTEPLERGHTITRQIRTMVADERTSLDATRLLGSAAVVIGAWDLAPALLAASVASLRSQGRLGAMPRVLGMQAAVAAWLADWSVAGPAAEEARALAEETQQPIWSATADSAGALAAAVRGDEETSSHLASRAEAVALTFGGSHVLALARIARGAAALGAGRPEQACTHFQRLFTPNDAAFHATMRWWALADFAEAAARADAIDLVAGHVRELESLAQPEPPWLIQTVLGHARAVLADEWTAEAEFQKALSTGLPRWPFQRARSLLAYGEWLRRRRRVAESRAPLRAARESFDAVGASRWSEHARAELRAAGETSGTRPVTVAELLTPQELQIAQLAVAGLTNRDIGRQLYLSHRTIESHLYRIFPKLGITSRAQLRDHLPVGLPSAG